MSNKFITYIREKVGYRGEYTDGLFMDYTILSLINAGLCFVLYKMSMAMINAGEFSMFSWITFVLFMISLVSIIHDAFVLSELYAEMRMKEKD